MSYIKLTNGQPENYTIGQLRRDNPNVSFPKTIPNSVLADYNVYPVVVAPSPSIDEDTQASIFNEVATLVNGQWTHGWTVVPLTAEQLQDKANAKAAEARQERDRLLAETDWMVVRSVENPGKPVSVEMKAYRQALRDLDQQAGWPANITWPIKPE